jgi:xanthine/CO dehydrogenase XdhC/CoxF family maturation factor
MKEIVWRKARRSGSNGGDCVEVAVLDKPEDLVAHKSDHERLFVLRDSKDPQGPRLYFTPAEWDAFRLGMKDGEFDDLS